MAETATDFAPNGGKFEEEAEKERPGNVKVAAVLTEEKIGGEVKANAVNEQDTEPGNGQESADKAPAPAATKASDEVVSTESSESRKGDAVPVEKDVKASSEASIDQKNARESQPKNQGTGASVEPMTKEAKEMVLDELVVKSGNFVGQKDTVAKGEDAQAMDVDDKIQEEKVSGKVDTKDKKAFDVAPPKKKLGRPKKIKVPEETKNEKETKELSTSVPETKKRRRQKKDVYTPLSERDRPSRERKSIERFVASVEKAKKELVIKEGSGTQLMDIPNVAFQLNKRVKGDDVLHMLHSLLFNKRAKANALKSNIFRFSGYVWTENEEKERARVREKLERCTKEGLGQLIDVLDLHLNKTGKKEELVGKVLDFLESPHKTTEVSLAEREQKLKEKKRKNRTPGGGRGIGRKRRKVEDPTPTEQRGRRKKNETEEAAQADYGNSGDESLEEEEEVERKRLTFVDARNKGDDAADDEDYEAKQKPSKKLSKVSKYDANEPDDKVPNEDESEEEQGMKRGKSVKSPKATSPDITRSSSKPAEKVYTKGSRKKSKEQKEKENEKEKEKEKEATTSKRGGRQKSVIKEESTKGPGRGRKGKTKEPPMKRRKKTAEIPADEVLQGEIRDLLKDLNQDDFSRVTYMDIVVKLEKKFKVDLSVQKAHVKLLIRQELSKLAEENEEEDDEQGANDEAYGKEAVEGERTVTTEAKAFKTKVDSKDSDQGEAAKDNDAEKSNLPAAAGASTEAEKETEQAVE